MKLGEGLGYTPDIDAVSKTRNGWIRAKTKEVPRTIARIGRQIFPNIDADWISEKGTELVKSGAEQASRGHIIGNKKDVVVGNVKIVVGTAADGLDGAWARVMREENPELEDDGHGNWKDPYEDAKQEKDKAKASFERASAEGDHLGAFFALGSMALNNIPRTIKAWGEAKGIIFTENGTNIAELLGVRIGRFGTSLVGSLAGGKVQTAMEGVNVAANTINIIARTKHAFGQPDPNNPLSQHDKNLAKTRAVVMTAVSIGNASEAISLGKEYYREMQEWKQEMDAHWHEGEGLTEANKLYADAIDRIERNAREMGIYHRFVGGTLTDLLTEDTKAAYDFDNRIISLSGHKPHQMFRSDGTVKDVDLVCFEPDAAKVADFRTYLASEKRGAEERGEPFPDVNIEPTRYSEDNLRNPLSQFVSGIDVDEIGEPHLVFGKTNQQISWKTLEPWTVQLEDGTEFTAFSPYAHALRYFMRVSSGLKPKDTVRNFGNGEFSKIDLVKLLARQASPKGLDFWINEYAKGAYKDWHRFVENMYHAVDQKGKLDKLSGFKALGTAVWWRTVGTALSHGAGSSKTGIFTG